MANAPYPAKIRPRDYKTEASIPHTGPDTAFDATIPNFRVGTSVRYRLRFVDVFGQNSAYANRTFTVQDPQQIQP